MGCLWALTILVVDLSTGYKDAGNLALAMSITNIFKVFATFGVRNFQVSDVDKKYSDDVYISSRFITVLISILFCLIYSLIFVETLYQCAVVMVYMLFIGGESFIDVLNGIEQKYRKLEYVGLSLTLRGIVLIFTFFILFPSFGLLTAILGVSISTITLSLIYDIKKTKLLSNYKFILDIKNIFSLNKSCLPIAIEGFLFACLNSLPKNSLELIEGTESLGGFNSATIPAFSIQLFTVFIYTPFITILAELVFSGDHRQFARLFLKIFIFILLSSCIIFYIIVLFGNYGLIFLFGDSIAKYTYLLNGAMISAFLGSIDWYLIAILTILRRLKIVLVSHILGFIVCILTNKLFIVKFGSNGVNLVQILSFTFVCLIQLYFIAKYILLNYVKLSK
jgi:O-antigen/teichoic acid export membrane protein